MDFATYVRKPFQVEAVEITKENIEEIAPMVGTLQKKDDGTPFILVDKKKVPNIFRVFPGWWVTKMDGRVRCYAGRVFVDQFEKVGG
jgi:hypothetical protein